MKTFFFLGFIIMSSTILSVDRFDSEERKTEEAFSDFSEKLVGIKDELNILNYNQRLIIRLLGRISDIADQYRMESWDNQPVFPTSKERVASLTHPTKSES